MELDVKTMFVVTIGVTAVLGLLLLYVWNQHRNIPSLAWWGGAHLIACVGVWLIGARGSVPDFWAIEVSNALLFVAAGMTWAGARLFDGNRASFAGIFGGAVAWLLATRSMDFLAHSDGPIVFSSMIIAGYTFATAIEFWRGRQENLLSRLPLIIMLTMHGTLYLARVPLALLTPGAKSEAFFSTAWFGVIGLESLLYMIAAAFIFLAMAKERTEMQHKVAATIDPLTGVANRRAFLDSAMRSLKQRSRSPQPVSALLFDLDRFKSINDRYGHAVGDRVLRMFTDIAVAELRSTDLLGRIGGEEFGAVLFGAEKSTAAATAERIRQAFAGASPGRDGGHEGVSVSIGVASAAAYEDTEIETLLTRADEALYVAKARGRNRVEIADGYSEGDAARAGSSLDTRLATPPAPGGQGETVALAVMASPGVAPAEGQGEEPLRRAAAHGGR